MTAIEMIYEFYEILKTVSPDFNLKDRPDTDTILMALNIGQSRLIHDRYLNKESFSENVKYVQEKFDDLKNIIKSSQLRAIPITTGHYNGIASLVAFPSDYLFYLRSDTYISRTVSLATSGYVWTPNEVAKSIKDIESATTNLFNKPILRQPVVTQDSTGIIVIIDAYTTIYYNDGDYKGFDLTYLRKPLYIGTTTECELATYLHEQIVRLAVDIYLKEYKFLLAQK